MSDLSNAERLSMFRRHQEEQRILKEKSIRDSIDARRTFERLRRTTLRACSSGLGPGRMGLGAGRPCRSRRRPSSGLTFRTKLQTNFLRTLTNAGADQGLVA